MKSTAAFSAALCAATILGAPLASALTYQSNGVIVQASGTPIGGGATACDAFGTSAGNPSTSTIFYPGQGATGMVLVSAGTPKPTSNTSNTTATSICTTPDAADLTGGSSMNFTCYQNSQAQGKTIPTSPAATISSKFNGAATSVNLGTATSGAAINVETVSTLAVGGLSCTFTTDATWTTE